MSHYFALGESLPELTHRLEYSDVLDVLLNHAFAYARVRPLSCVGAERRRSPFFLN